MQHVDVELGRDEPEAYIARDRRRALATRTEMPDRVRGAALFADISGGRRAGRFARRRAASGTGIARAV